MSERPEQQIDGPQRPGTPQPSRGPIVAARRIADWICRRCERRAAIRGLEALNDHYLKDIGLERCGIVASLAGANGRQAPRV